MDNMSRLVLVSMIMASGAAAENRLTPSDVDCGCDEPLNRFGISYRAGFNISAKFKNFGNFTSPNNPGPATGGMEERFYDDGYNRVDQDNNAGNVTVFWGYENSSQYDPADGGSIAMNSTSARGNVDTTSQEDDPQHGLEITFNRQLGKIGKAKWGIEAAANFTDVNIHDNGTLFGDAVRTTDVFELNGVIPPVAPSRQTFDQMSGPVLGTIPFRTITRIPNGATITGKREFDAEVFGLRIGPYLEIPLHERLALSLSGGFALLWVNSDFGFEETVTLVGGASRSASGRGTDSDLLPGGYIGGNFIYSVNKQISVHAGAQFQAAGNYSHTENGKEAELNIGQAVFFTLGIGYTF